MSWVGNAEPTVQRQRGWWVVRVSGYDAATGRLRVHQLGTFSTKRAATAFLHDVQSGRAGGEDEVPQVYLREVWLPSKESRVNSSTFHLALVTGVRRRELLGLAWDHVDLDTGRITVVQQLTVGAGVPQLTPKGLRHTAQSIGRVVVGDDKVMQERLGHSDVEISRGTYAHVVDEQHQRAGGLIDTVFLGQP